VQAVLRYTGSATVLVHDFKFKGDLAAGHLLGVLLGERVSGGETAECIVPVPSSRRRRRQRGFDPAVELARPVASALGIPLDVGAATRPVHRAPQSTVDWHARWRNVADVFHVKPRRVTGRHVAIVDDVLTSGATVTALAESLLAAGAARVDVWVACRAR
jgi:ComF family protein